MIKKEPKSTTGVVFLNTFLNLFSKFLTYLTYAVVAYLFGAQRSTDIYYLGTSFVTSCTGVFIIVMSSVFSPMLIRIKLKNSLNEARVFAGSFFAFMAISLLVISCVLYFFPVQVFSVISRFPLANLEANRTMLALFAVVILFTVVSEFGRIYIESLGFFAIVAYVTLLQALVFILLILGLAGIMQLKSLVIGLFISLIIQSLVYYWFCKKNKVVPIINLKYNQLHTELIKTALPLLSAHVITLGVAYMLDFIASGLAAGSLTAVTFANRIYSLPLLLLFNPALEVINTKFSEYYHADKQLLTTRYLQLQRFFIMLLTPAMIILIFYRLPVVKIFFLRGEFGLDQAVVTANSLGVYACSIVSFCILSIIARVYFIMQKTGWSSFYGTINQLLTIALAYFFSKKLGYIGIPLAKVGSELIYFLPVSFWLVNKYLPVKVMKEIVLPFLGLVVIAAVLGYGSYRLFLPLNAYLVGHLGDNKFSDIASLGVAILLFATAYFYILLKLKFAEMSFLYQKVQEALSRFNRNKAQITKA